MNGHGEGTDSWWCTHVPVAVNAAGYLATPAHRCVIAMATFDS